MREAWATLPESSSQPLPATLARTRNLAHASLKTAVGDSLYYDALHLIENKMLSKNVGRNSLSISLTIINESALRAHVHLIVIESDPPIIEGSCSN